MSLRSASLITTMQWVLQKTNAGFGKTVQGPDTLSFSLPNLSVTTFDEVYNTQLSLASGATQTVNLTSMTNLIGESFGFGHVLALMVTNASGSPCAVSPGATNPATWFFNTSGAAVNVPPSGMVCYSDSVAGPGQAVTSGACNLKFFNAGPTANQVNVSILGGTS